MEGIRAIETVYAGYRFRSRLEARWAVFFDALGIEYDYEPEGFDLGEAGWYLPDFFLNSVYIRGHSIGVWFEVKGVEPTNIEKQKATSLGRELKQGVVIACGDQSAGPDPHGRSEMFQFWPFWDNCMEFMKCEGCGLLKTEYAESNYAYCPKCGGNANNEHPDIVHAALAAKQARFEHMQVGAPSEWHN